MELGLRPDISGGGESSRRGGEGENGGGDLHVNFDLVVVEWAGDSCRRERQNVGTQRKRTVRCGQRTQSARKDRYKITTLKYIPIIIYLLARVHVN